MVEPHQPSIAKSEVAKAKARDPATGKFLSPEAKAQVQQQAYQQQYNAERSKINNILGKSSPMQQQPIQNNPQQPIQQNIPQRSNFQDILAANKPGARQYTTTGGFAAETEEDKWNNLLGKKRQNIRW